MRQPVERKKLMAKKTNTKNGAKGRMQTFSFQAPAAMSVQLVGDFTQWQQNPISMHNGIPGGWHAEVELAPGPHQYRFLVDGEWVDDPECTVRVPNPFGSQDCVCQVG